MTIAAFEGFYGGSHKQWLDGLAEYSEHEFHLFTLSDRFWKWRMRGGAVTLARKFRESGIQPDCLLVTDMLDVPLLLSLIKGVYTGPVILYMHENQLTYPWSSTDPDPSLGRDHNYAFINYVSCLAADRVCFNSAYHMHAFMGRLPGFLSMFPDSREIANVEQIQKKSDVLPLGLDLRRFDAFTRVDSERKPTILWNHRWEYDKDPEAFFSVMKKLSDEGFDFDLIVCGESTSTIPEIFDEMTEELKGHIRHWGTADMFSEYAELLLRSDILPVTSRQDFFGISVVEAMYCGVMPLLPDRLAFPEHIPSDLKAETLYANEDDLLEKLRMRLNNPIAFNGKPLVGKYDWSQMISTYDDIFRSLKR